MALVVSKNTVNYDPIPDGIYPALCYTVADLGVQYDERYKKFSNKVLFVFEICDDDLREDFGKGKLERRAVSEIYSVRFGEKSNLYKDVRPWIGAAAFDEGDTFDFKTLAGRPCMLTITNNMGSNGRIYSNISAIAPLMKGIKLGSPENPIVIYDIDNSGEDVFLQLPEWVRKKIQESKSPDNKQANSVNVNVDTETGEVLTGGCDMPKPPEAPDPAEGAKDNEGEDELF